MSVRRGSDGEPLPIQAVDVYGDDTDVILCGLLDGAQHATCKSCRDVMQRAYALIRRQQQ